MRFFCGKGTSRPICSFPTSTGWELVHNTVILLGDASQSGKDSAEWTIPKAKKWNSSAGRSFRNHSVQFSPLADLKTEVLGRKISWLRSPSWLVEESINQTLSPDSLLNVISAAQWYELIITEKFSTWIKMKIIFCLLRKQTLQNVSFLIIQLIQNYTVSTFLKYLRC